MCELHVGVMMVQRSTGGGNLEETGLAQACASGMEVTRASAVLLVLTWADR